MKSSGGLQLISFSILPGVTNYAKAFNAAFILLKNSYQGPGSTRQMVIMFLTDGSPSDDKGNIMQTIKDRNAELHNKVVIMTYGMLVDKKILLDIANQDGTSYGVSKAQSVTVSKFMHIIKQHIQKRDDVSKHILILSSPSSSAPLKFFFFYF